MSADAAGVAGSAAFASNPYLAAGATVLGSALQSKPSTAVSSADSIFGTNLSFDNSGWNVSWGGSKIDSTSKKTTSQDASPATGSGVQTYLPYVVLFVGALVAWKILKK